MRRIAENLEEVADNIGDLRSKIDEDLESDDEQTRLIALAAALLDKTYARPGDPYEDRDSKGILTLQCQNVDFEDGEVTLSYTGKSGVEQERSFDDANVVEVFEETCEDLGPQTEIFKYKSEDGTKANISPEALNDYLEEFGFTAKDIRQYHANELMEDALEEQRDDGPDLNKTDDRDEQLKSEFEDALEETAKKLGHEPSTLKEDYLVGDLEDEWIEDVEVTKKYARRVALRWRVARRHLAARRGL